MDKEFLKEARRLSGLPVLTEGRVGKATLDPQQPIMDQIEASIQKAVERELGGTFDNMTMHPIPNFPNVIVAIERIADGLFVTVIKYDKDRMREVSKKQIEVTWEKLRRGLTAGSIAADTALACLQVSQPNAAPIIR
jgi:hypothetical protein